MSSKRLHPNDQEYTPTYNEISENILEAHAHRGRRVGAHGHGMAPGGQGRQARHQTNANRHFCGECKLEHPAEWRECASCKDEHSGCCNATATTFYYKGQLYKVSSVDFEEGDVSLALTAEKHT